MFIFNIFFDFRELLDAWPQQGFALDPSWVFYPPIALLQSPNDFFLHYLCLLLEALIMTQILNQIWIH